MPEMGTGPEAATPEVAAFGNRLRKNLAHWQKWARRRGISCYRIYDRDVPQFPFAIDRFETVLPREEVHFHVQEIDTGWRLSDEEYAQWINAISDGISEACGCPLERLHLKRRERKRGLAQYEKIGAARETFVVEESGHRFEVNFDSYLDAGLFLDHRPGRALVAKSIAIRVATGAQVAFLNLFAYTGSFTVYAAVAGACRSTTVDLSNTYQAWSARNLALNGIDLGSHALERADVIAWLSQAASQGRRFDVIVLDPPSFSNSKKMQGVLDVQRDHVLLVRQCHALLAPRGELFFSTNLRSFEPDPGLLGSLGLREITHQTVPDDFKRPNRSPPHRAWLAEKQPG
jgi:23S rRNA (cytosine1962-C5)-methyltransferase